MREPDEESNAIAQAVVAAALEVHRALGPAFVEKVYESALCHELSLRRVTYRRQFAVAVHYKGIVVGEGFIDIFVADRVVVELKAVPCIAPAHIAQVISYLKAARVELGLLINFGERQLRTGVRRVVLGE